VPTSTPQRLAIAAGLAAVAALAFHAVPGLPFIHFDDPEYVTGNPFLRGGLSREAVAWALTSSHAANWHPLTWVSHLVDVSLFGMDPRGHHAVNLLLHCANVALLFLLLERMTGDAGRSALAAALFALHPLRVESVAWVSERKDVLSAFFWIATTLAWVGWTRRRTAARYALVLLLFALGLASKQMLVTLPFTLLLLDAWPLRRIDAVRPTVRDLVPLVVEKLPLLALSATASVVTFLVQSGRGATRPMDRYPFPERLENAAASVWVYLADNVWPASLSVFYPHPEGPVSLPRLAGLLASLAAVTALAWVARRRAPWVTVGWLWFLGTLVPVLGLIQVGNQARADRYTYVPSIGLALIVAWSIPRLQAAWARRTVWAVAAALVALLGVLTVRQVEFWASDRVLFEHADAVTRRNWLAETVLGMDLERRGDVAGAAARYQRALQIHPQSPQALNNLGSILVGAGARDRGIALLQEAVRLWPGYTAAVANLGSALAESGRLAEGLGHLRTAAIQAPDDPAIRYNLGLALEEAGRPEEALVEYEAVIRLVPGDGQARASASRIRSKLGRP
jgi:protein O-mannosyl-transferase